MMMAAKMPSNWRGLQYGGGGERKTRKLEVALRGVMYGVHTRHYSYHTDG